PSPPPKTSMWRRPAGNGPSCSGCVTNVGIRPDGVSTSTKRSRMASDTKPPAARTSRQGAPRPWEHCGALTTSDPGDSTMKFGLLYEAQRPFKGKDIDWNKLYKETLEQCVLADRMGFDNLWFVEHHFLTGFSGSPCPEVLLGALSQMTRRI